MLKRIIILSSLALALVFVSCETSHEPITNIKPVPTADIDVNAVQAELSNVVGFTLKTTAETMDKNEALLEESSSLSKTADYSWNGEYHIWENTVDDGAFHGEFLKKIQYKTSKDGKIVEKPSRANYMYSYASATGTYGFIESDPWYGTTFDHFLETEYIGFKTLNYEITINGQYSKVNQCVYNGEDAVLDYVVTINIDQLKMSRAKASTISITGEVVLDMNPWKAVVVCDGTNIAKITIYNDGVPVVEDSPFDLTSLVGLGIL